MLQWKVGEATITSILESQAPTSPRFLFEGVSKADVLARAEAAGWLRPHFVTDEGFLLLRCRGMRSEAEGGEEGGNDEGVFHIGATVATTRLIASLPKAARHCYGSAHEHFRAADESRQSTHHPAPRCTRRTG